VLRSETLSGLIEKLNFKIKQGWQPSGGPRHVIKTATRRTRKAGWLFGGGSEVEITTFGIEYLWTIYKKEEQG
jgi:hypothetical protein